MLRLFGPPTVTGEANLNARMAYVAAAMVDLAPSRTLRRAELSTALWPWAGTSAASNNFRQLLSDVRRWERTAGRQLFEIDNLSVSRTELTEPSDLSVFLQTIAADSTEALRRLNELYRGDLLEGVEGLDGDAGIWLMAQRDQLRSRFTALGVKGTLSTRDQLAQDVLERLSKLAPYDEEVVRAQMIVGSQVGGSGEVASAYRRYSARLHDELGDRPGPKTAALFIELTPEIAADPNDGRVVGKASLSSVPRVLILAPHAGDLFASPEPEKALAFSLIDEVTHSLSRARTFAVFAPHTARQLSAKPFISGNPYGADYLVATSLRPGRNGERRLLFTLTDLTTHEIQLSEELTFNESSLGADHYAMAASLASQLAGSVERREMMEFRSTGAASAYVHYLLGLEALRTVELQAARRARKHFLRAIKLSPRFARARAMLARSLSVEYLLLGRKEVEPLQQALAYAYDALEDSPADPLVHREIGHALIYFDRLDEAVDSLQTASNLGPHFADVLCTFADSLIHIGRHREARPIMDKALSLNPLPPDLYHWISATSYFLLGDYRSTTGAIARMAAPASAGRISAAAEALSGNLAAAHKHRDLFMMQNPDFRLDSYVFPIRNSADKEHLIAGLRVAGFP